MHIARIIKSAFLLFIFCTTSFSQITEIKNSAELELALQKLNVLGSVLYIGAHPDDENTGLMAYLSKAKKYRTAYLSLTRGDGGQNLIGSEKGVEIGILRTQELLQARRIDGGEQYFTRAIDFGYSKSPEESFSKWGKDSILADMIWVIRKFKPDVIITRFSPEGSSGHGHHTASAILAKEAFRAAGDPSVFPEQLKYVKPWKAKKIFWNSWRSSSEEIKGMISLDISLYNPLLGKSYSEIAAEARSMHKSQGFGTSPTLGSRMEYFQLLEGGPSSQDLLDGINTTWDRVENASGIGEMIASLISSYKPSEPAASLDNLISLLKKMNEQNDNYWITLKKQELLSIIKYASGLWLEAAAPDYTSSPGNEISIKTTILNRGIKNIQLDKIDFPTLAKSVSFSSELELNQPFTNETEIALPENYPVSQPYWLKQKPSEGLFSLSDKTLTGMAENPPAVPVNVTVKIKDEPLTFTLPLIYKWNDKVEGEQHRLFTVSPPVTININEKVAVLNGQDSRELQVILKSYTPSVSGELHLHADPQWKISPDVIPFSFLNKYDEQKFVFSVTPPKQSTESVLNAEVHIGNKIYNNERVEISYSHIPSQVYFPKSEIRLVKIDLKKTAAKIGYIMGSGDEIPACLENLGYPVTMLSDDMLERGDLSGFNVIIAGIRAYNTRERLKYVQPKLMKYVKDGGTFIVQYNTPSELKVDNPGPYPFTIGNGRISVEESPVNFITPDHQLLNYPNKITEKDFSGWIQERGLYFAENWDPEYQVIISGNDPGEKSLSGGTLFTHYGKGIFIYSAYSWFRELPAGVPGAYRLFINMISANQYVNAN